MAASLHPAAAHAAGSSTQNVLPCPASDRTPTVPFIRSAARRTIASPTLRHDSHFLRSGWRPDIPGCPRLMRILHVTLRATDRAVFTAKLHSEAAPGTVRISATKNPTLRVGGNQRVVATPCQSSLPTHDPTASPIGPPSPEIEGYTRSD